MHHRNIGISNRVVLIIKGDNSIGQYHMTISAVPLMLSYISRHKIHHVCPKVLHIKYCVTWSFFINMYKCIYICSIYIYIHTHIIVSIHLRWFIGLKNNKMLLQIKNQKWIQRVPANGYMVSLGVIKISITMVMATQLCEYTRNQWICIL